MDRKNKNRAFSAKKENLSNAKCNKNDRDKKCFNESTGNKMINIQNQNMSPSMLTNFSNNNFPFNNNINYININSLNKKNLVNIINNNKKNNIDIKTNANGLANIGSTCYMNATLQCLAHIQRLTYHLLNSETKKKILFDNKKYKLTSAY